MNQVILHSNGNWLDFSQPVEVIQTSNVDQVIAKLNQIEKRVLVDRCYAIGFIGYESASGFDSALSTHNINLSQSPLPLLSFGLFNSPKRSTSPPSPPKNWADDLRELKWQPTVNFSEYQYRIKQIKNLIVKGATYQVNYTHRLQTPFTGRPLSLFHQLLRTQLVERSIFIQSDQYAICSASPELFFYYANGLVTMRPMKGTRQRNADVQTDLQLAEILRRSTKDQAENIMIVDMVRNDLGQIATFGSVITKRLFDIERYPTVWQMTSTVTAQTTATVTEIVTAIFPCASITGAPKPRTTAIINTIEPNPRGIYTGAVGIIQPDSNLGLRAEFNVAIRTAVIWDGQAEYGIGSGIVWDSRSWDEYRECQIKAEILNPLVHQR